jgi:hypothetical protein
MIIELQRQWIPARPDVEEHATCALCGQTLEYLSVMAYATTDDGAHMGWVSRECIRYLGDRNVRKFPRLEEYRALLDRYPEPMFESNEALEEASVGSGYAYPWDLAAALSPVWGGREGEGFTLGPCEMPSYSREEG